MNDQVSKVEALKLAIMQARAKKLIASRDGDNRPATIQPASRNSPLPLSWAQQRLWFLDQLEPAASNAYHIRSGLRLKGKLDESALRATLNRIVDRHENLRTRFVNVDGTPVQEIMAAGAGFELDRYDLSRLDPGAQEAELDRHRMEQADQPFDLAHGPLIRGRLLCMSETGYVLLLTQHHIISDGWSLGILVKEVTILYRAFVQGLPDPLPPLPLQYADYALWQRNWLQGDVLQKQIGFWKKALAGAPALLTLPTDRPRPAVQSYAGQFIDFQLSSALSAGLRSLAQRHGTTLFMTLLAGWAILLSRYAGQQDVVIGSPVANRQRSEIEALIGCFVNTLALRVRLDDEPDVAQLLARVKADTLEAYSHQDLPFEQVVEAINPPRGMSHNAIFQVMLAMNTTPAGGEVELPGLALSAIVQEHHTSQFDLSLSLVESDSTIAGRLEYASDLFNAPTIRRLAGGFEAILHGMVADSAQPVSRLGLLDATERERLLLHFNATASAFALDQCIHHLFEAQVGIDPQAIALIGDDQSLTYAELNRRANQLAHYLRGHGVKADDRIAICVERSIEMVVGLLGILKAGAAYVPLDPAHPVERLGHMISDSRPVALLTQTRLQAQLPEIDGPTLLLDSAQCCQMLGTQPDHNPGGFALPGQLAYVLYTSGSTGLPKGVMVEHRNVVNLILHHIKLCEFTKFDRVMQFASFGFDTSITEIFPALSVGAQVVLRPAYLMVPDSRFVDFLRRHQITIADLPTAFWHQWASEVAQHRSMPDASLRLVIVGGEKAEQRHLQAWFAAPAMQQVRWINTYGPTETTIYATAIRYAQTNDVPPHEIPIGAPVANTRVYILDQHLQPLPIGVAGELYIAGSGVARGYLNLPDLSAERFINDPFSADPNARMYKSGDLGRWLEDGNIEYLGRSDFQVKIRGFRIELGEIEARLSACDGVREALVIAREDRNGDKRLVAYLIPHPGSQLVVASLRQQLLTTMAEYMVPSAFVTLDAYPLNPNGKIDRKALPQPDLAAVVTQEYEAPQGRVETMVAGIWQDMLELARVGRQDHFFELGGHSLLATQLISRLKQTLDVDVALHDLFAYPTLSGFAARIQTPTTPNATPNLLQIRRANNMKTLFFIHDGTGGLGYVHKLLPSLDADMTVYGLLPSGLAEGETPLATIEEMAALYLRQIRTVQPRGPYHLLGYSAGGMVAYEMANQLLGMDQRIAFLGLIDTLFDSSATLRPQSATPAPGTALTGIDVEVMDAIESIKAISDQMAPGMIEELTRFGHQAGIDALLLRFRAEGWIAADMDVGLIRRFLAVGRAITIALDSYPRPHIGIPMVLFAAIEQRHVGRRSPSQSFERHNVRHIGVPGNHFTMMDEANLPILGSAIAEQLAGLDNLNPVHSELRHAPCVTINPGSPDQRPLFCVPGAGATVIAFAALAREMPASMPIYGLQPRGYCGLLAPHIDVPAAAQAYVNAIREIAPLGPYRLIGHSFGGWVVLEMAHQLLSMGHEIEFLAVLDSTPPIPGTGHRSRHYSRIDALMKLVELYQLTPGSGFKMTYDELASLPADEQMRLLLTRLIDAKLLPPRTAINTLTGIVRVFETNLNTDYAPASPYPGDLYLVSARDGSNGQSPGNADEKAGDWRRLAPKTIHRIVPGNHNTLLTPPHVVHLAALLKELMAVSNVKSEV
jgi:amino acid adenylation domain-containing protein